MSAGVGFLFSEVLTELELNSPVISVYVADAFPCLGVLNHTWLTQWFMLGSGYQWFTWLIYFVSIFFFLFKCWHYTQICFSISEKLQSVSHLECCEGTATATEHLCVGVAAFIDLCSHSNNMISVLIIAIYRHTPREILAYVADWVILLGPPGRQMPDWWTLYTKSNLTFLHFTLNSRVDFLYSIVYMWILHFLQ